MCCQPTLPRLGIQTLTSLAMQLMPPMSLPRSVCVQGMQISTSQRTSMKSDSSSSSSMLGSHESGSTILGLLGLLLSRNSARKVMAWGEAGRRSRVKGGKVSLALCPS